METNQRPLLKRFLPLIIFVALVALLAVGLTLNPRQIPSPLIGKPAPDFELPLLLEPGSFSNKDLIGHVTLVNIWASWCVSCRAEHETLKYLARSGVRVIGLNYKDEPEDAKQWLAKLGNPYQVIAADYDGHAGIEWGVYATPETFLIDKNGIIQHKVIGPLTDREKLDGLMAAMALLDKQD